MKKCIKEKQNYLKLLNINNVIFKMVKRKFKLSGDGKRVFKKLKSTQNNDH